MNLILALDHRFLRTPDGSYWSTTLYRYSFWSRYLGVFDRMSIVARVHYVPVKLDSWKRVDGDRVTFAPVPAFVGPWQYLRNFRLVRAAIQRADLHHSAVLSRVPGWIPSLVISCLRPGHPYGIEVVADPYDAFSPRAVSHPLRPFFRWWFTRSLKRQCQQAACNLYLTERALQARYPPADGHFTAIASESDLQDDAFVDSVPKIYDATGRARTRSGGRFRLSFVGNVEALYKAPDVLITALARSVAQGLDAEVIIIGDGREKPKLQRLADRLGITERVKFLGQLPAGEVIRRELDSSDLFVLPSRQEGMPKALIEAMARGLPCISTPVGGIPELLPADALVPRNDAEALAGKILSFARDPKLRLEMARKNLDTARRFHESILQPRRIAFFQHLAAITGQRQKSLGA